MSRKDSRLSFRISPQLSSRIDAAIRTSGGDIRDRSEFGTKAIRFYLDSLAQNESHNDMMIKGILAIAKEINYDSDIIEKLQDILLVVDIPIELESHPDFEKILILREKLSKKVQGDLDRELEIATYDTISIIYEEFRNNYYLEGTGAKSVKSTSPKST